MNNSVFFIRSIVFIFRFLHYKKWWIKQRSHRANSFGLVCVSLCVPFFNSCLLFLAHKWYMCTPNFDYTNILSVISCTNRRVTNIYDRAPNHVEFLCTHFISPSISFKVFIIAFLESTFIVIVLRGFFFVRQFHSVGHWKSIGVWSNKAVTTNELKRMSWIWCGNSRKQINDNKCHAIYSTWPVNLILQNISTAIFMRAGVSTISVGPFVCCWERNKSHMHQLSMLLDWIALAK